MEAWHSYPKVYNLGHPNIDDLLKDPVTVEEKIDGSQFSFGTFTHPIEGVVLKCRSKGAQLNIQAPEGMFIRAVEVARDLAPMLQIGWCYRCEYLLKPKHNTLAYSRTPEEHLILFDINTGMERYMPYEEKAAEAGRIGLEVVPLLFHGTVDSPQVFRDLLSTDSVLGGQPVEGVVAKNYERFGKDGHPLMGKFVSEKFKEVHAGDWRERNPGQQAIITQLSERYKTPARWQKSYQLLRDTGVLEHADRDIGTIIKAIPEDILEECGDEIKDALFKWAWPQIRRRVVRGMPEWYKEKLMERQFEESKYSDSQEDSDS